jgi:hypothetical protein
MRRGAVREGRVYAYATFFVGSHGGHGGRGGRGRWKSVPDTKARREGGKKRARKRARHESGGKGGGNGARHGGAEEGAGNGARHEGGARGRKKGAVENPLGTLWLVFTTKAKRAY